MKHVAMRGVIIKDNHLVVMERHNKGRHYFVFPGGRLEEDESKL